MKKSLATLCLAASLGGSAAVAAPVIQPVVYHHRVYYNNYPSYRYVQHRRHMRSLERIGGTAAGGALIGGLAGGGKGAAIGALLGGGGGYLWDRHEKHHGHF